MSVNRMPPMIAPPQLTKGGPTPPAVRPQAVRAAFFAQALGLPSVAQEPTPTAARTPSAPSARAAAPDPDRPLRPGSLLDIRI